MEYCEFFFTNPWHWLGGLIYLAVAACGMTAEEIREATGRMTAFARDFIRQSDNMEEYQRDYDTAGEEQASR